MLHKILCRLRIHYWIYSRYPRFDPGWLRSHLDPGWRQDPLLGDRLRRVCTCGRQEVRDVSPDGRLVWRLASLLTWNDPTDAIRWLASRGH